MKAAIILWYSPQKNRRRVLYMSSKMAAPWNYKTINVPAKIQEKYNYRTTYIDIYSNRYCYIPDFDFIRLSIDYSSSSWFSNNNISRKIISMLIDCHKSFTKLQDVISDKKILNRIKSFKGNVVIL